MDYVLAWELLYFPMEQSNKLHRKFTSRFYIAFHLIISLHIFIKKIHFLFLDTKANLCKDGSMAMVYFGEPTE